MYLGIPDLVRTLSPFLLSIGGLGGLIRNLVSLSRAIDSENWDRVDCEIIESRVKITRSYGTAYLPIIGYKYIVNGSQYQGKQLKYGDILPLKSTADGYCREYATGRIVKVSVDPNDPKRSVLEPGPSSFNYFEIIIWTVVGAIGFKLLFNYFTP